MDIKSYQLLLRLIDEHKSMGLKSSKEAYCLSNLDSLALLISEHIHPLISCKMPSIIN
jgi:hypothetical protein